MSMNEGAGSEKRGRERGLGERKDRKGGRKGGEECVLMAIMKTMRTMNPLGMWRGWWVSAWLGTNTFIPKIPVYFH